MNTELAEPIDVPDGDDDEFWLAVVAASVARWSEGGDNEDPFAATVIECLKDGRS